LAPDGIKFGQQYQGAESSRRKKKPPHQKELGEVAVAGFEPLILGIGKP
jgi:hypothetical protein